MSNKLATTLQNTIKATIAILLVALTQSATANEPENGAATNQPSALEIDRPDHPLAQEMIRAAIKEGPRSKEMRAIFEAQNVYRERAGLPALSWSRDLQISSADLVAEISSRGCSAWSVESVLSEEDVARYWASWIRGVGGEAKPQDLSGRFVASEWELGGRDYSAADGLCMHDAMNDNQACHAYAQMMGPKTKSVGCAYQVCASGAQVWICSYDGDLELARTEVAE